MLGQSLREPVGDEFEDACRLAPAAHAVQQLAVTHRRACWFHPPQLGKNAAARREKVRMREGGWLGSPLGKKGSRRKGNEPWRHLNVGTAAGGMKEASWMRGTMHCSFWKTNQPRYNHKEQVNDNKNKPKQPCCARTSRAWKYLTKTLPNLATVYFSASSFCLRASWTLLHRMTRISSSPATMATSRPS